MKIQLAKSNPFYKSILLFFSVLCLLSCLKDDGFPQTETTTQGKKWNLEIGSSPLEVFGQLQELGTEKNIDRVSILYRLPYSNPEQIQSDIALYDAITIETTSGILERTVFQIDHNKVSAIEKGGGMLEPIQNWPEDLPSDASIYINDPVEVLMEKLTAIYQLPLYQNYQLVLPGKSLAKPYDPDMVNYDEWFFTFSENISSSVDGRNSVRLFFKNEKLVKIKNEYEEFEFVN
ncbi:hypothetical protein MWU78_09395 [Arenibacter sp. F26102]|uniref:hypothetical protein n=1 Tax=Arenibacter sp. F26102 TaxID=2926416 RepID=UPI001FF5676E|nr:hypothetical protein [Arenibacter sp. F26102]MCK0145857.1 hypothetical protein [Arenibacter sp. F26102]